MLVFQGTAQKTYNGGALKVAEIKTPAVRKETKTVEHMAITFAGDGNKVYNMTITGATANGRSLMNSISRLDNKGLENLAYALNNYKNGDAIEIEGLESVMRQARGMLARGEIAIATLPTGFVLQAPQETAEGSAGKYTKKTKDAGNIIVTTYIPKQQKKVE